MSDIDTLLEALRVGDGLRREVERLRAIEEWALSAQPFKVGDLVVIETAPSTDSPGWRHCREFLVAGCTGVIVEVHFNESRNRWGVLFRPDVQWSADDGHWGRRYSDQRSSFYFDPRNLRRRKKRDKPLAMPEDAQPWRSR